MHALPRVWGVGIQSRCSHFKYMKVVRRALPSRLYPLESYAERQTITTLCVLVPITKELKDDIVLRILAHSGSREREKETFSPYLLQTRLLEKTLNTVKIEGEIKGFRLQFCPAAAVVIKEESNRPSINWREL